MSAISLMNWRLFCSVSQHVHSFGSGTLMSKPTKLIDPSKAKMRLIEFDDWVSLFYISCNVGFLDRYKIGLPFLIATTQLLQQFASLHLADSLTSAAWMTPEPRRLSHRRRQGIRSGWAAVSYFRRRIAQEFSSNSLGAYFDSDPSFALSQFPLGLQVSCQSLKA
jgi:hypothetical protein